MDQGTAGRFASLLHSWYRNRPARGFSVTLELLHRCNVRCVFCSRWDDPDNLGLETIEAIAEDMTALGAAYVSLSGGDPLVRSDFPDIVRLFVDRRIPVHINTNGVLLAKYAPFLKSVAASIAGITVSIDSHDPEVHDRIRGMPGTFRRAFAGMEALRGTVPLSLACTLTEMNRDGIDAYARFARELGFDYRFQPVHDDGANKLSPNQEGVEVVSESTGGLDGALAASLPDDAPFVRRQYYRLFAPFFRNRDAMNRMRCIAAARLIYFVDPTGEVFPCDTRRDRPLGNVYRRRFAEIVGGTAATGWRALCRAGEHGCACMYACIAPNNVKYQDFPLMPLTRGGWPLRGRWRRRLQRLEEAPVVVPDGDTETGGAEVDPFVTVVVANYNGGEFLLRSVRALLDLDYPVARREILMVDDASTDGSLDPVREHFFRELESGALRIVVNPKNLGVAGAYNRGVREARPASDFIMKVDNDLLVEPGALRALVDQVRRHPGAGIFGGRILEYDENRGSEPIHYLGGNLVFSPTGRFRFHTPARLLAAGGGAAPRRLDVVNGCMVLVRTAVFRRVGLFPEFYGRYEYEDYDFALKAKRMGFASLYCPAAVGRHRVSLSSSTPELSRFRLRQRARNGVIFMYRFAPRVWFPLFVGYHLAKIPFDTLRKGHPPGLLLSGYLEGLRLIRRNDFPYTYLPAPETAAAPESLVQLQTTSR